VTARRCLAWPCLPAPLDPLSRCAPKIGWKQTYLAETPQRAATFTPT
jgi:hypothetical protein